MRNTKFLMLGLAVILFFGCAKDDPANSLDETQADQVAFKGMVFDDWDAFYEFHNQLQELETEDFILNEVLAKGYTSFLEIALKSDDPEINKIGDYLTLPLMAIMNEDYNFKVGDKLVSFRDGSFYESAENSDDFKLLDNIQIAVYDDSPIEKGNSFASKLILGNNGSTGGQSRRDFTRQRYIRCGTSTEVLGVSPRPMRFFQQLKSVKVGSTAFLFVETKLFWRNSKNELRLAETEERNYTYNISGTLGIAGFGPAGEVFITENINFRRTVSCTRHKWNRQEIASAFPVGSSPWHINLSGTITHHINGDSSANKWYAAANWTGGSSGGSSGGGGGGGEPRPIGAYQ